MPNKIQTRELQRLVLKFQCESAVIQHTGNARYVDARDTTAAQIEELYEVVFGTPPKKFTASQS